jgi:hypothetical protein
VKIFLGTVIVNSSGNRHEMLEKIHPYVMYQYSREKVDIIYLPLKNFVYRLVNPCYFPLCRGINANMSQCP